MDRIALKKELQEQGLIILPGFFDPQLISQIQQAAKAIFDIQFKRFGIEGDYLTQMQSLFEHHLEEFISCGKMIQSGLVELYQLAVNPDLMALLKDLGLSHPLMCTRPVLFFNHPSLAKSEHFYKTPLHQDWTSMLASDDSVVVWLPLMDLDIAHGPVIFYPGSHKLGPLTDRIENGFAEVDFDRTSYPRVQKSMKLGDVAIFSTLLVHESGVISNGEIRWSCHFRYTNMEDPTFIANGFPHPYIYKPSQELIDKYLHKNS
jgi:ectoine hydroxylase-related dioxygenase (phytanoyl-CoA dioxygenase family)